VLEKHVTWSKKVRFHNEDVLKFEASFNLMEILSFLKALEGADELKGVLGENLDPRAVPELEQKLRLKTMPALLPGGADPQALPEFKKIRKALRDLIDRSFAERSRWITNCLQGVEGDE
jgi:hypothetical protein